MNSKWLSLVWWVGICLLTGFVGSLFAPGEWYQEMQKSALTPPNYVFPIVWNILFVLMGIAAWRVWGKRKKGVRFALSLFLVHLIFNMLWSYLFFGIHRPDLALFEIVFLWVVILLTIIAFIKVDRLAGIIMLPYIAWVSFAIYLNYAFVELNRF